MITDDFANTDTRTLPAGPAPIPAERCPFPFRTRRPSPPGPMVLAPNPAPAEQVGAGHAGRIRDQSAFDFQGRPEAPPRENPRKGPEGGPPASMTLSQAVRLT